MSIKAAVYHLTHYKYDRPVILQPQIIRLQPAPHSKTKVLSHSLKVLPAKHFVNVQQDPYGNYLARFVFPEPVTELRIEVDLVADMTVYNPFDFFVEERAETWPFDYPEELREDLVIYRRPEPAGPLLQKFIDGVDRTPTNTVNFITALNARVQREVGYIVRLETGVYSPEETLGNAQGSCRDSSWLLVQALRHLGFAARFVSGYLIQLKPDLVSLDGLWVDDAKKRIIDYLEDTGRGAGTISYRIRDWLFSRQRYWGEPFPVVYDEDDTPIALPASALPVELPEVPDFSPRTYDPEDASSEPEPPLGRNTDWLYVELDLGDGPKRYRRDANTMPNWAGSCWYYLRYLDPRSDDVLVDPALEDYWMGPGHGAQAEGSTGGVDLYVGGVEHAVLHLLYARFWHKVLYDLGHVRSAEPFHKLFNQGYIQAYAYTDERGVYVPAAEVVEDEASPTGYSWDGKVINREYGKMGKALKNSVSPDEMYEAYGAYTLRVYEMSMGPLDLSRPWETRAVVGAQRFLQRLWRNVVDETTGALVVSDEAPSAETLRVLHRTIEGVREDMEGMRINTAIAKLIVLNNHLTTLERAPRSVVEALVVMTAPVAPHVAEELWARLGHDRSVVHATFPQADPQHLVEETVTCVFQVQGKVRGRAEVAPSAGEDELRDLALADAGVQRALAGRDVRTVIVRAPRLVNVVPA